MSKQLSFADLPRYPAGPGYRDTDTSKAAAAMMKDSAESLRSMAYTLLCREPLTADEVAAELGETVLSIRPRITELNKKGLIFDSGNRRANKSGRYAVVWSVDKPAGS